MNIYYKIISDINKRLPDILNFLRRSKLKIVTNPRVIYDVITYRDVEKYGNMKLMKYMKTGMKFLFLEKGSLLNQDLITRVHVLVEKDKKLYLYCLIDRVEDSEIEGNLMDVNSQLRHDNLFQNMTAVSEAVAEDTNKLDSLKEYVSGLRYELDLPLKLASNSSIMIKSLPDIIETRYTGKFQEVLELACKMLSSITYDNLKLFNTEFHPNVSTFDIFKIKVIEGADYIYKIQNVKNETLYFVIRDELYLLLGLPQDNADMDQLLYSYCKIPLTDKMNEAYTEDLFSKLISPKKGVRIPVRMIKHTFNLADYESKGPEPVAEALTKEAIMNMEKIPYRDFDKSYAEAKDYWEKAKVENDPDEIKPTLAYVFCLADRIRLEMNHYESPMKGEELKESKKIFKQVKALFREIEHFLSIREPGFNTIPYLTNSKYSPVVKGILGVKTSDEVRQRYKRTIEKLF